MGVIGKQSFKSVVYSYAGIVLGYLNWAILVPLFLNKEEMGFVRVLFDLALILATVFGLGVPQAVARFYPYNEAKFSRKYMATYGTVTLAGGLLFVVLFFFLGPLLAKFFETKAPLFNSYTWILFPIVLFAMAFDFFDVMNRVRLNISSSTFVREIFFRLLVLFITLGFGFKLYDFDVLVYLLVVAYGLQALCMMFLFFLNWQPDDSPLRPGKMAKDEWNYTLFLFLMTGGTIIINQIDSIMTGGIKGLEYAAVYGMGFFISGIIGVPFRSVNTISNTLVAKFFSENNLAEINKLYRRTSINLFLIGAFLFLGIWLNLDFLFSLIPDKPDSTLKFSDGKWVFFLLGLSRLVDSLLGINSAIFINSRYYIVNVILVPALGIATVAANLWLIPLLGINGAALTGLTAIVLYNLVRFAILWAKMDMFPFTRHTPVAVGLFLAVLAGNALLHFQNYYLQMLWSLVLIVLVFLLPCYLLGMSPELVEWVRKLPGFRKNKNAGTE